MSGYRCACQWGVCQPCRDGRHAECIHEDHNIKWPGGVFPEQAATHLTDRRGFCIMHGGHAWPLYEVGYSCHWECDCMTAGHQTAGQQLLTLEDSA